MSGLQQAGIDRFVIVVGYRGQAIKDWYDRNPLPAAQVTWIENTEQRKDNGISVLCARRVVHEPFLLVMADHIFQMETARTMLRQPIGNEEVILATDRKIGSVFDLDDATKVRLEQDRIVEIGKDLRDYNALDTGMFLCSEALFASLERAAVRGNCSLSDGLRLMAKEGKFKSFDIGNSQWQDVDTPAALDNAQRLFPRTPRALRAADLEEVPMEDHSYWQFYDWQFYALFVFVAMILLAAGIAQAQEVSLREQPSALASPVYRNVIVIGFVGGFVSRNDTKHPEVQFSAYLRDRYPLIHAEVFGNHHARKALDELVRLLDTDHDGIISPIEKEQSTIIIYGHSWGATETAAFASELGRMEIPVALTIQIDTIGKPGHRASPISPNVTSAINFYQTRGPLHGAPEIVAFDPARTTVLGNIRMTYEDRPINCDNYSWYSRTLNKPHHEIENDFRVWDQVASLIDSDLTGIPSLADAPSPSRSPFFEYIRRGFQARETETAQLDHPSNADGN
jgi:1L-myo-inositol 1-phosphate cytidylyltransferase